MHQQVASTVCNAPCPATSQMPQATSFVSICLVQNKSTRPGHRHRLPDIHVQQLHAWCSSLFTGRKGPVIGRHTVVIHSQDYIGKLPCTSLVLLGLQGAPLPTGALAMVRRIIALRAAAPHARSSAETRSSADARAPPRPQACWPGCPPGRSA